MRFQASGRHIFTRNEAWPGRGSTAASVQLSLKWSGCETAFYIRSGLQASAVAGGIGKSAGSEQGGAVRGSTGVEDSASSIVPSSGEVASTRMPVPEATRKGSPVRTRCTADKRAFRGRLRRAWAAPTCSGHKARLTRQSAISAVSNTGYRHLEFSAGPFTASIYIPSGTDWEEAAASPAAVRGGRL